MGKYFGTDGFRGKVGKELCAAHAYKIGKYLSKSGDGVKILVVKDTRLSSDMLECALSAGIASGGGNAYLLGVNTTACASYLTYECGISPFDLFNDFGNAVDGTKMRLSDYAENLYNFFKDKCDSEILKEKILCDLLSCSSSVQIPETFKVRNPIYKQVKKYFIENVDKNVKIAVLYKSDLVYAVNQTTQKDLHGRYIGEFFTINDIKEKIGKIQITEEKNINI